MKIVLLNPPNFDSLYVNRDLMGGLGVNNPVKTKLVERVMSFVKARSIRLPVLSLVYSATVLARDFDVEVLDAGNLELTATQTVSEIAARKPDMLLSTTSISTLMQEAELACSLKDTLGLVVGLLGDAATQLARPVMERYPVDFIVKGDEPEFTLGGLAQAGSYRNLKAIVYRDNDGGITDTGVPETIIDLDSLPFPKWELFPVHVYRYFPILRRAPFLPALSTRGCPYGCIYCPYTSNQGLKYRYRSAQHVVNELVLLKRRYNVNAVQFRDPTFTIRKERTVEICDGIVRNGLDLEWGCETRVDRLNPQLIDKMVKAGLKGVNIGIESIDKGVISNVHRGWIDPDHIRRMVRHMVDSGIRVSGFFIVGLPGETRRSIEQTLGFAKELPLSYAEFKVATPFPGTPLFEMAKENKWIDDVNIEQYTSYEPAMRISEELDPAFLKDAASRAYSAFYRNPRRLMREVASPAFLTNLASVVLRNAMARTN